MTDIDIVAELRRLYAAAPQGKWATGQIDGNDYILQPDDEYFDRIVCLVDDDRLSGLIVAMYNDLPKLLAAIEATRAAEAHLTAPCSRLWRIRGLGD